MTHPLTRTLLLSILAGAAALLPSPSHGDEAAEAPDKALCPVCRVQEGTTEEEEILATAEYEGVTYGFCSETCRDTFLQAPAAYLPPVFPRPAPAFHIMTLQGQQVSSDILQGKVTLLDFWASWCLPCVVDLPKLTDLHQRLEKRGFQVLSVSIDEAGNAVQKISRLLRKKKVHHPVFLDGGGSPAWETYLVAVVPTQFLIDAKGQIVAQWSGTIDLAVVEEAVLQLLPEPEASAK
jgi:thiol-disulfide isomerase/thioredoxin